MIDNDRRENGDYYKKPTQFWFINFDPLDNLVFEPLDYVEVRRVEFITKKATGIDRQIARSEINPQYASRFIRRYILPEEMWRKEGEVIPTEPTFAI